MNKLVKKLNTQPETIEAYAGDCDSTCYYNCSFPCSAHVSAGGSAYSSSNGYQSSK